MTTLNIHNETNINAKGTHTTAISKPVICVDTGEVFASITDAAEHFGVTNSNISHAVRGIQKTCKGKRFCYLSKATENIGALTAQISKLNADAEDARRWREHQAEQERVRRAEEERIRAEQERIAAIERARQEHEERVAKANEKVVRRNRIVERLQAELAQAIARRDDAVNELNELNEEEVA